MTADDRCLVHATAIAAGGRAALILGPPGAGKSGLALRAITRPFVDDGQAIAVSLVADDQVAITREGDRLLAAPPPSLAGLIEVRGLGIVPMAHVAGAPLVLAVRLAPASTIERMPDPAASHTILGLDLPAIDLDPGLPGASARLVLALLRIGTPRAPIS